MGYIAGWCFFFYFFDLCELFLRGLFVNSGGILRMPSFLHA